MLTVLVGLAAALVYGSADFFGGLSAKRLPPVRVTLLTSIVGLLVMLALSPIVGGRWSPEGMLWGALSGVSGSIAILLLYAALAIGPMSILSPLTAVISAIVPMTWGLLGGDQLPALGFVALFVALVAVMLVGFVPERGAVRPKLRGLLYATASGVLIGVFFVLIDRTPADSGLSPLVANRVVAVAILGSTVGALALLARQRGSAPVAAAVWRPTIWFILACGVLDAGANALTLVALRIGELSVASVLVAMYPAGTIILAAIVLRERIAPVQWVGLALALAAAGMLALA